MTSSARLIRGGLSRSEIDTLNSEAWQVRRTRPARAAELSRLTHLRAETMSYRRGVGQANVVRGFLALEQDHIDIALTRSLGALTDLEPDGPTTWLAWAHITIARVASAVGEHERAATHFATAQRTGEAAGDTEAAAAARLNAALITAEPQQQVEELRAATRAFEEADISAGLAYARYNLAESLFLNGDVDEAREIAERAAATPEGPGTVDIRLSAETMVARCHEATGERDVAVTRLRAALDAMPDASSSTRGEAGHLLASMLHAEGDRDGAVATLAHLRDSLPSSDAARVEVLQVLADRYAESEDYDAAYATLRALQDERQEISAESTRRRTAILEIFYRSRAEQHGEEPLSEIVADLDGEALHAADAADVILRDELTDLPNATRLDRELTAISASTTRRPVCLALIDIDELSVVNAELGHLVGDTALRQVARVLEEAVPGPGLLARVDGEDFALLLDDVALEEATEECERLRTAVERHPLAAELRGRRFTVSIGVAEARTPFDAVRLVRLADDALYAAKDAGRNRVVARRQGPDRPHSAG